MQVQLALGPGIMWPKKLSACNVCSNTRGVELNATSAARRSPFVTFNREFCHTGVDTLIFSKPNKIFGVSQDVGCLDPFLRPGRLIPAWPPGPTPAVSRPDRTSSPEFSAPSMRIRVQVHRPICSSFSTICDYLNSGASSTENGSYLLGLRISTAERSSGEAAVGVAALALEMLQVRGRYGTRAVSAVMMDWEGVWPMWRSWEKPR